MIPDKLVPRRARIYPPPHTHHRVSLILTFAKFAQNTSAPPAAVLQCARTASLHATEVVPAASHVAHTTFAVNGHATAPAVAHTKAQAASVANRMALDISVRY